MTFLKHCEQCGKEFISKSNKARFCCHTCKAIFYSRIRFQDKSKYVECKICGMRGRQLIQHIEKMHNMTPDEYCQNFDLSYDDLQTDDLHNQMSANIKKACADGKCGFKHGCYNPAQSADGKTGRNSAWSMNFRGYDGLSDEEKIKRISALGRTAQRSRDNNHNNVTKLDYYTSRGYSETEAKKLLRKRQQTFSLKTCIEKYGEEQGRQIYHDRQLKWQNTLNSKSADEIERINRSKFKHSGYSKISQQLFDCISEIIKNDFKQIFYATNSNSSDFNEYMVFNDKTGHRYFLDFYIKDNNKVIEFDGDYWHGEKTGRQNYDKMRETELNKLGFVNIYHVKERDYKSDPNQTIKNCIDFLKG